MSKIDAYTTGAWAHRTSELQETPLGEHLNFKSLSGKEETEKEALSIFETLIAIAPNGGLFVRSGKGSIDVALFSIDGVSHIIHSPHGVPHYSGSKKEEIVEIVSTIGRLLYGYKQKTVIIIGALYHHLRHHDYGVNVVADKGDITPYYNSKGMVTLRNFHHGDDINIKPSFIYKDTEENYNGLDFGSGKVSFGGDIECKVYPDDIELTVLNVLNFLKDLEKLGIKFN